MLEKIKFWIVDQVLWAEHTMTGLSGKEKRDAVVRKLDEMIKLPPMLEPFDGSIIGFFVDMAVSKLNDVYGRCFGVEPITQAQEKEIADALEIPAAMADGLKDVAVRDGE